MTVGQTIKRLRLERKLSQRALAKRAGVSQQLVSQIENEVNMETRAIPKFAMALNVPVTEIDPTYAATTTSRIAGTVQEIPILTAEEIIADAFTAAEGNYLALSDVPPGDWISMTMTDDAMDRIAPAGAVMVINRAERALEDGGFYAFSTGRDVVCRRYRGNGKQDLLLPFSFNPEHYAVPYDKQHHTVVGRCRRSLMEL